MIYSFIFTLFSTLFPSTEVLSLLDVFEQPANTITEKRLIIKTFAKFLIVLYLLNNLFFKYMFKIVKML